MGSLPHSFPLSHCTLMIPSSDRKSPEAPLLSLIMRPAHSVSQMLSDFIGPRPVVVTKQDTEMDKAQQEQVSLQDLQATAAGEHRRWVGGQEGLCHTTWWPHCGVLVTPEPKAIRKVGKFGSNL